jgi:hypothetical protein
MMGHYRYLIALQDLRSLQTRWEIRKPSENEMRSDRFARKELLKTLGEIALIENFRSLGVMR